MKSTDIPCIKDKCILLPICKNKQEIICDTLILYLYNLKPVEINYARRVIFSLVYKNSYNVSGYVGEKRWYLYN